MEKNEKGKGIRALRVRRRFLYAAIVVILGTYLYINYEERRKEAEVRERQRIVKEIIEKARREESRDRRRKLGSIELDEEWKADDLGDFPGSEQPP